MDMGVVRTEAAGAPKLQHELDFTVSFFGPGLGWRDDERIYLQDLKTKNTPRNRRTIRKPTQKQTKEHEHTLYIIITFADTGISFRIFERILFLYAAYLPCPDTQRMARSDGFVSQLTAFR